MIPGFLISILTFPGVIVHEAAHKFFCDRAGVKVRAVCYFRFGNPAGYVIHEAARSMKNSFLIAAGPLILNSTLSFLIALMAFASRAYQGAGAKPIVFVVLLWLALSIGMHAMPSIEDAQAFSISAKSMNRQGVFYLVALPFLGLVTLANILKYFWFDLIYACILSYILPSLIFK